MTLKLKDLFEMTHKAGIFTDYSPAVIARTIKGLQTDARLVTKLEGGKYSLYTNHDYYFLQRDHEFLGFVALDDVGKELEVKLIYVLPKYRKRSITVLLIYAVKEVISKPLIIKNSVFDDGEKLIDALHKHKRYNIQYRDKAGRISDYSPGMIPAEEDGGSILIECGGEGFWCNPLEKLGLVEEQYWRYYTRFPEFADIELPDE